MNDLQESVDTLYPLVDKFAIVCRYFVPLCKHEDSMSKYHCDLLLHDLQEHADTLYLNANISV